MIIAFRFLPNIELSSEIDIQLHIWYISNTEFFDQTSAPYSVHIEYRALRSKYSTIFDRQRIFRSNPNLDPHSSVHRISSSEIEIQHRIWYIANIETEIKLRLHIGLCTDYRGPRSKFSTAYCRHRILSSEIEKLSTIFGSYRISIF